MEGFNRFALKMQQEGLPVQVIATFQAHYKRLRSGDQVEIDEKSIVPLGDKELPPLSSISSYHDRGISKVNQAVVIKLNGGLGTTMGLNGPKSLIDVRPGRTFLDCAVEKVRTLRRKSGAGVPLVLMNSFSTETDTAQALRSYPDLSTGLPLSFLQHKYPKIDAATFEPVAWPADPALEWNPPGHGDLYTALETSGLLDILIDDGRKFAFISNCDNLGATFDPSILGYMDDQGYDFVMEVTRRTPMDSKGGHIARLRSTGQLMLREYAQCPERDREFFGQIATHRFFNTNNLWLNLVSLKEYLTQNQVVELPLIVNPKTVDPRNPESPSVLQLETAMGAAISLFPNTQVVEVGRERFVPVKTCSDLLAVWSDRYGVDQSCGFAAREACPPLTIDLDQTYYSRTDDLAVRFPHGAPSLRECSSLVVQGDVRFGRKVKLVGAVTLQNHTNSPVAIADNEVIEGTREFT